MKGITISQADESDIDEILYLNKKLFEFERQFTDTYNLNWTYSKIGMDYFRNRLTQKEAICLKAIYNNQLIAYLIAFTRSYPYRAINPITEVENMFVEPAYRNKGIGGLLIAEAKKRAKKMGAKRLRVEAISANSDALKFYKKWDFPISTQHWKQCYNDAYEN